jgi:hypothetical protein
MKHALQHVPLPTVGSVAITLLFAAGLLLQPIRWEHTPAYGNLLDILSAQQWGWCYLAVSIALMLGITFMQYRIIALGAHVLAFVLLLSWEAAFIVRWGTDKYTTIANVGSWLTFLIILVVSARQVDDHIRLIKTA